MRRDRLPLNCPSIFDQPEVDGPEVITEIVREAIRKGLEENGVMEGKVVGLELDPWQIILAGMPRHMRVKVVKSQAGMRVFHALLCPKLSVAGEVAKALDKPIEEAVDTINLQISPTMALYLHDAWEVLEMICHMFKAQEVDVFQELRDPTLGPNIRTEFEYLTKGVQDPQTANRSGRFH